MPSALSVWNYYFPHHPVHKFSGKYWFFKHKRYTTMSCYNFLEERRVSFLFLAIRWACPLLCDARSCLYFHPYLCTWSMRFRARRVIDRWRLMYSQSRVCVHRNDGDVQKWYVELRPGFCRLCMLMRTRCTDGSRGNKFQINTKSGFRCWSCLFRCR